MTTRDISPNLERVYLFMPWGRVGSNLILDIFAQHELIRCHNEPLTGIATREDNVSEAQKDWYRQSLEADTSRVDFINLSAVSIVDLDWFLEKLSQETGARHIFLSRRNLVLVVLSILKARHYAEEHKKRYGRASWAVRKGKEINTKTPIVVEEFERLLKLARDGQRKFTHLYNSLGGLNLYYEDIQIDLDMVIREICSHICLDFFEYETRMVKAISRPYSEEFSGLSVLKDEIKKTDPDAYRSIEQVA